MSVSLIFLCFCPTKYIVLATGKKRERKKSITGAHHIISSSTYSEISCQVKTKRNKQKNPKENKKTPHKQANKPQPTNGKKAQRAFMMAQKKPKKETKPKQNTGRADLGLCCLYPCGCESVEVKSALTFRGSDGVYIVL